MRFLDRYCTGGRSVPAWPSNRAPSLLTPADTFVATATKKDPGSSSWPLRMAGRETETSAPTWIGFARECERFGWRPRLGSTEPVTNSASGAERFITGSHASQPRALVDWWTVRAGHFGCEFKYQPGSTWSSSLFGFTPTGTRSGLPPR